jgi:hypothetical protein
VFAKIFTAPASYDREKLEQFWVANREYQKMISKRGQQSIDYREEAAKSLSASRPSSNALARSNKTASSFRKGALGETQKCKTMTSFAPNSKFKRIF